MDDHEDNFAIVFAAMGVCIYFHTGCTWKFSTFEDSQQQSTCQIGINQFYLLAESLKYFCNFSRILLVEI